MRNQGRRFPKEVRANQQLSQIFKRLPALPGQALLLLKLGLELKAKSKISKDC